jgi:hypothetical protein
VNRNMTFRIGALALAMFSMTSTASASVTVSHQKIKDRSLIANLFYADDCNIATTSVHFAESVERVDGEVFQTGPLTLVEVDYVNGCTGESLTLMGNTTVQNVHFEGDLGSATLSTVVPVATEDGANTANVTLNLVWTANGPLQQVKDKTRTRNGDTIVIDKIDLKLRTADITGTATTSLPISTGSLPLNLALSTQGGTIGKDMIGERTITKTRH